MASNTRMVAGGVVLLLLSSLLFLPTGVDLGVSVGLVGVAVVGIALALLRQGPGSRTV